MSIIDFSATHDTPSARKDNVTNLWRRLFRRDTDAVEQSLAERDMIVITATLLRLNDRQLKQIGLSRATLSLDVDDLARRAKRDAQLTSEILRIVESDPQPHLQQLSA